MFMCLVEVDSRVMNRISLLIFVLLPSVVWAVDNVSDDVLLRFNETALRAENALSKSGPEAAIELYERALREDDEFGRVNLRLGQLYEQLKRFDEAAYHFQVCSKDTRVDSLDRELICQTGFSAVTAPLVIEGLPAGGQAVVIEPERFAGPFKSGDSLPRGLVRIVIEAPGREPHMSEIEVGKTDRWTVALGAKRPTAPVEIRPDDPPPMAPSSANTTVEPQPEGPTRWPSYLTAGLGAGLVGGGLYLGFTNRTELADIRDRQRGGVCGGDFCELELVDADNRARLADGLWIGGATMLATSVILWFVLDGESTR